MTYTVEALDDTGGMACKVTATAKSGKYSIETTYITDPEPQHGADAGRVQAEAAAEEGSGLQLYVRFDPTVNGNGGGGSGNGGADSATVDSSTGHPVLVASDTNTATNAANRDYAQPVFAALDGAFSRGVERLRRHASDGLDAARRDARARPANADATGGNVVQVARVDLKRRRRCSRSASAPRRPRRSARPRARSARRSTRRSPTTGRAGRTTTRSLNKPPKKLAGLKAKDATQLEDDVLPQRERDQGVGGQDVPRRDRREPRVAVGPGGLGRRSRRTRTSARTARCSRATCTRRGRASIADGDLATARDATLFLFERQQLPDGSMPRNSLVNGKTAPDSFGTQLDETAYPILMAYQLGLTDASLYTNHIKPAANFLAAHGPSFGVERWEEQSGYSPSTIAAAIAGLVAAADLARANGDTASAAVWLGVADDWQRSIKGWTVTTNGPLAPRVLHPALEDRRPERRDLLQRRQRRADARPARGHRRRLPRARAARRAAGERPGRARVAAGRRRDDQVGHARAGRAGTATTATATATAPADGRPWAPSGQGTGHLWPVLSAERARAVARDRRRGRRSGAAARDERASRRASG